MAKPKKPSNSLKKIRDFGLNVLLILPFSISILCLWYYLTEASYEASAPQIGTVCDLNKNQGDDAPLNACLQGFQNGTQFMDTLLSNRSSNCNSIAWPTFSQIYSLCAQYYEKNQSYVAPCLSGAQDAITTLITQARDQCVEMRKFFGLIIGGGFLTAIGGEAVSQLELPQKIATFASKFSHWRSSEKDQRLGENLIADVAEGYAEENGRNSDTENDDTLELRN